MMIIMLYSFLSAEDGGDEERERKAGAENKTPALPIALTLSANNQQLTNHFFSFPYASSIYLLTITVTG